MEELGRLIDAGVESRAAELVTHRAVITNSTKRVAMVNDDVFEIANAFDHDRSVAQLHDSVTQARQDAETALRSAEADSEQFAKVRERTLALAQQLRGLATEIIGEGPADECPLCHTKFEPGELSRHMALGVDDHIEDAAQELLSAVSRSQKELEQFRTVETAVISIVKFLADVQLPADMSLQDALSKLAETKAEHLDFELLKL